MVDFGLFVLLNTFADPRFVDAAPQYRGVDGGDQFTDECTISRHYSHSFAAHAFSMAVRLRPLTKRDTDASRPRA
jgi:hypothetical protein